jgi:hypothetical protein
MIGKAHLMLGWRDLMKLVSTTTHNHTVNVTKRVGCDRNGTSHVRVKSLDEVSINYIVEPHR